MKFKWRDDVLFTIAPHFKMDKIEHMRVSRNRREATVWVRFPLGSERWLLCVSKYAPDEVLPDDDVLFDLVRAHYAGR